MEKLLPLSVFLSTLMFVFVLLCEAGELTVTEKVYFDISIGNKPAGRITIGLFGETVPRTVRNFADIAAGKHGYSYTGNKFHRVIKNFMIQAGDIDLPDGTKATSIYGGTFDDENFIVRNYGAGWVGMANYGKNTNIAQFYIPCKKTEWLDGHHVVFGVVLEGMKIVHAIENTLTNNKDMPLEECKITESGVLPVERPFDVENIDRVY
ncbi:hypothetical protein ScPMuIL_001027 [Solemya velum]